MPNRFELEPLCHRIFRCAERSQTAATHIGSLRLFGLKNEHLNTDQLVLFGIISAQRVPVPANPSVIVRLPGTANKPRHGGSGWRREPEHLLIGDTIVLDLPDEQKIGYVREAADLW